MTAAASGARPGSALGGPAGLLRGRPRLARSGVRARRRVPGWGVTPGTRPWWGPRRTARKGRDRVGVQPRGARVLHPGPTDALRGAAARRPAAFAVPKARVRPAVLPVFVVPGRPRRRGAHRLGPPDWQARVTWPRSAGPDARLGLAGPPTGGCRQTGVLCAPRGWEARRLGVCLHLLYSALRCWQVK